MRNPHHLCGTQTVKNNKVGQRQCHLWGQRMHHVANEPKGSSFSHPSEAAFLCPVHPLGDCILLRRQVEQERVDVRHPGHKHAVVPSIPQRRLNPKNAAGAPEAVSHGGSRRCYAAGRHLNPAKQAQGFFAELPSCCCFSVLIDGLPVAPKVLPPEHLAPWAPAALSAQ